MVPCTRTVEEVSFEWSHHRISSTDSKVRTTLHVSIINCRSDSPYLAKSNEAEEIGYGKRDPTPPPIYNMGNI